MSDSRRTKAEALEELERLRQELTESRTVNERLREKVATLTKKVARIENMGRQLEVLSRLNLLAAQASTLDGLAEGVVSATLELLAFDDGGFYIVDHEERVAVCRYHFGDDPEYTRRIERLPIDRPESRSLYLDGRPIYLEDFQSGRPKLSQKSGLQSAAAIPIPFDGKVIATLGVACKRPHVFTEFEKRVLEATGQGLGNAIARLQSQDALRASEKRYRTLAEETTDVIWMRDLNLELTYVSPSVERLRGFTQDEAMEQTIHESMTPDSAAKVQEALAEEIAREQRGERHPDEGQKIEVKMRCKDGSTVHCEVISRFLRDDDGNPSGIIGVTRNVSDRAEIDRQLRESEKKYRQLTETLQEGIWAIDAEAITTYVNPAMAKMLGYTEAEMNGRHLFSFMDEQGIQLAKENLKRRKGGVAEIHDFEFLRKDGSRMYATMSTGPINDEDNNYVGAIAGVMDVTDRRQAAEALRESEETFRALAENSYDTIMRFDRELRHLYVNPAVEPVTGVPPAEFIGKTHREMGFPEPLVEHWETALQAVIDTGTNQRIEFQLPNGIWIDWLLMPELGSPGRVDAVITTARDITDYRQKEEQLRQSQKLEAIGRLAGGVAHDFNNILMGVVGGASMLRRRTPKESEAFKWVEKIADSAQSAALLANQLLAFARGGKYMPAPQDLNELVDSGLELMRSSILTKVWVEADQAKDLPPVEADRAQVFQVLMNLCKNAVDAMTDEGVIRIVTRRADPSELPDQLADREDRFNVLSVSDSGPGIPVANREHIFDPFFTTKDYGRGLGLAAVYGIVQNHHGAISVDDAPTGGARFTIFLPTTDQPVAVDSMRARSRSQSTDGRSLTVLVVDDEATPRDLASSMLESLGHRVLRASSGSQAVEILRRDPDRIDIALVDAVMPEMDGNATFEELAALKSDLCVVFFSGFLEEMVLPSATREKARGFIKKPFTVEELAEALRSCGPTS